MTTTYEDSSLHTGWHACALEHNIHLAHAVDLPNSLSSLLCYRQVLIDILPPFHWDEITRMRKPILDRKVQSPLINVRNDNLPRTLDLRNSRTQQADSSSTIHNYTRILRHQTPPKSMQRNPKRLQQRSHIQPHLFRKFITPLRRVINPLLQCPLEMRKTLAAASEPKFFADVVATLSAAGTRAARKADFEGDFVAFLEV